MFENDYEKVAFGNIKKKIFEFSRANQIFFDNFLNIFYQFGFILTKFKN